MSAFSLSAPRSRAIRLADRRLRFSRLPGPPARSAEIIVTIALHNQGAELRRAIESVLEQDAEPDTVAILVLDDESTDDWDQCTADLLAHPRVAVAHGCCGSPAHARNALLDLVDESFPRARWVARLDADDSLATKTSLRSLVEAGEHTGADFVIGSNYLRCDNAIVGSLNRADPAILLNRARLTSFIDTFCSGQAEHELPSCNLVLRAHSSIRYPITRSAEDHWLISGLLMFRPDHGCVVTYPAYAVYSIDGQETTHNCSEGVWRADRLRLRNAALIWHSVLASGKRVLGWGNEGIVWEEEGEVRKQFYSDMMTGDELLAIQKLTRETRGAIIPFEIKSFIPNEIIIRTEKLLLKEIVGQLAPETVRVFLKAVYDAGVVPDNIKRGNIRLDDSGALVYIDIGRDIQPLTVSRFLDCAARLYAVGVLGWSDFELARRPTWRTALEGLYALDGFAEFYRELILGLHPACDLAEVLDTVEFHHEDVTLLIKSCPQDEASLATQVRHLIGGLCGNTLFARRVLLIDPRQGPFLRQYADGNLVQLLELADFLKEDGWLDEIWIAPTSGWEVNALYLRWFGADGANSAHTLEGAPLFAQLWAFERIGTRFVLQMDIDVIVGLADASHDVIADMKHALDVPDVWTVGFNIPKGSSEFQAYMSPEDGFVPEIRMGMLDLPRIFARRPFENPLSDGQYVQMWHRALEGAQRHNGMRSLRGGDGRSFYVHPRNEDKTSRNLAIARDLIGQGWCPLEQAGKWDLDISAPWQYPRRAEDLVFLLLGRDTPPERLARCIHSLARQNWQGFGVILIEDAGDWGASMPLHHWFGTMRARTTIIRRAERAGYIKNIQMAVLDICLRPESLIVVLDQDDALMREDAARRLWCAWQDGADLVNAPMFRPEKPLALYPVCYSHPRRGGGRNVWAHLRAFRKALFEQIPKAALAAPEGDIECLSDYLTMVPMAELASHPIALEDGYYYLHEREPYSAARKRREAELKLWLFRQMEVTGS